MNRRTFLKNIPVFFTAVAMPTIPKGNSLPLGYISEKAKEIRKKIDKDNPFPLNATKEQSKQLLDELLDNSNPTEEQFEETFDRCIISADTLYRLSAHGFKRKSRGGLK